MREVEHRSLGGGGTGLFWRLWSSDEGTSAGRAVICHGYAEHGGRYRHVAERLTGAGLAVVVPDHRGHGRSDGRQVSVGRFDEYVEDLHQVLLDASAELGVSPTILLGHSMGGLIAAVYAIRHPEELRCLVLSAPAVVATGISPLTIALGRLLGRVVPEMGVIKLPLGKISRDPGVVAAYMADPLVHPRRLRARLGAEMLRAIDEVAAGLPRLTLPVLVIQGSEDALVDPSAATYVHDRVGSSDRTIRSYPGLYHEIFNEPEREQVLDDLVGWVLARISQPR
ncbi:MAG: lysophospholipase [Candidatus Dormibacteria bacterium]